MAMGAVVPVHEASNPSGGRREIGEQRGRFGQRILLAGEVALELRMRLVVDVEAAPSSSVRSPRLFRSAAAPPSA